MNPLKKTAFYFGLVLAVYIGLETASLLVLIGLKYRHAHPWSWILSSSNKTQISLSETESKLWPEAVVAHPYVGFVNDVPAFKSKDIYGFNFEHSSIQKKMDQKLIIAISGGSVACQIEYFSSNTLIAMLKKSPRLKNRNFIIIRLCNAGYKQPQQLMALTYLLSLGGEIDILINIDGFNEVALPPVDNRPYKVFPFFPRNWFAFAHDFSSKRLRSIAKIHLLENSRVELRDRFSQAPFKYSTTARLVWKMIDHQLQIKIALEKKRNSSLKVVSQNYQSTGPVKKYVSDQAYYEDLAAIWVNSSLLMDRICKANGIRYFHFLQPNQYFEGSKELSPEERRIAYKGDHPYREGVVNGYPLLVKKGEILKQQISFYDLTGIFRSHPETLYSDDCCHSNQQGYDILAEFIGQSIIQAEQNSSSVKTAQV